MAWSIPFDGVKMFHLEAIVRAKDIEKKFRAELAKSVFPPILGVGADNEMSAFARHFRLILPCRGKIENMFQHSAIKKPGGYACLGKRPPHFNRIDIQSPDIRSSAHRPMLFRQRGQRCLQLRRTAGKSVAGKPAAHPTSHGLNLFRSRRQNCSRGVSGRPSTGKGGSVARGLKGGNFFTAGRHVPLW